MTFSRRIPIAIVGVILTTGTCAAWTPPVGPPPNPHADAVPDEHANHSATGTLTVHAVQGTPEAPAIGVTKVDIHLYGRQGLIGTIERMLDEHGECTLEDIPLGDGVQPMVVVHHDGVTYQKVAPVLDPTHASQSVEVVCFELTEEEPDWTVPMRHVMVEPVEGGIRVVEMLSLDNPEDRTWRGAQDLSVAPADKRVTTRFTLPHGVAEVELGRGFHEWCCTTRADHALVNHLPLMPTGAEFTYSYVVPASGGQVVLDMVAPAPNQSLMVIVPQSLNIASFAGLSPGGEQVMNEVAVNYFVASDLSAGDKAQVKIDGLGGGVVLENTQASASSRSLVKIIAGVGGGLFMLAAIVIVLARPSTSQEAN